jgi:hypothetical protein
MAAYAFTNPCCQRSALGGLMQDERSHLRCGGCVPPRASSWERWGVYAGQAMESCVIAAEACAVPALACRMLPPFPGFPAHTTRVPAFLG